MPQQESPQETLAPSHGNNIIDLPSSRPLRLERAIAAFDSGDNSNELRIELEELAKAGFSEANYFLGCMFEDGTNGEVKNLQRALALYEKTAGSIGYLEAYLGIARLLYHGGDGVVRDYLRAKEIYEKILNYREHPVACFMLGRMYQHGQAGAENLSEAEAFFNRAISQGSVFGLINLSLLRSQQKRRFSSIWLRLKAAIAAYRIARINRHDVRLRGG